ncbi:MAG: DUF4368 domain-containing protein [Oscillospiraceae bacterium]
MNKLLTSEIINELIEKIIVYSPNKSGGHKTRQIDIFYLLMSLFQLS